MFERFKTTIAKIKTATVDGDASAHLQRKKDSENLGKEENELKNELQDIESKVSLYKNAEDYYDVISGEKIKEIADKLMNSPENLNEDDQEFLKKHRKVIEANVIHEEEKKIMNSVYNNENAGIASGLDDNDALLNYVRNKESNFSFNIKTPEWVKNSFGKTRDWLKNNTKKVGSLVMEKMGKLKNWGSEKIEDTKFLFSSAKIEEFDTRKIAENIKTKTLREEIARGGNFGPNHEIEKRQFVLEQFLKEKENYLNQKKLILDEHKIKKLEKLGKLGDFIKLCEKGKENTREFWKNLDNSKIGRLSKVALSSGIMSASVGLTGAGLGWIPGTRIGSRMATNMLIATGVNMAFSSNRPEQIKNDVNNQKAKNFLNKNLTVKSLKTLGYGASLTAGFLSGGFPLGLASLGIGVGSEYLRKKINEYIQKKSKEIEDKQDKNKLTHKIAFENIKDNFDVEKLSENLSWVNSEIENAQKMAKNLSIFKTVSQKGLTYGTGLATMFAFSTESANAQNQQNQTEHNDQNNDTKTEEVKQNQAPNLTKSEAPTVNTPENTTQTPAPEVVDPNTNPTPTPTPETKVPEVNLVEVKPNDGGLSQVLQKMENRPDWFEKVLGKDTPENWAKLMKKMGTFNPEDPTGKDSFTIHPGDKIGLTDNKEVIFERGGQSFLLAKVDEHGHLEEGDWMDKMQDEKFMDTGKYSGEISNASSASNTNEGGDSTTSNDDEKIDPNNIVEPKRIHEAPLEDPKSNETPAPATETPDARIEKLVIEENPYKLGPAQLEYIDNVYKEGFMEHVFKNEESIKWWDEISNTKSAKDFLNLDREIITDKAQEKLFRVLTSIHKITGLEPMHATVLQPEIPNETIKQYIMRGLQHAYMHNNLNDVNIEGRPITI